MIRGKLHFGMGLGVGILLSALFFNYFAPRYHTKYVADTMLKQDSWSGDSWRFVDGEWHKIDNPDRNWEKIDKALQQALHFSDGDVDVQTPLTLLKKKHLCLRDVPNDELLGRIKHVYSRQILTNLYLKNFLKLQEKCDDVSK